MANKNTTVLVIEDNEDLSFQYRLMLQSAGFEVTVTDTKRDAINKLRDRNFSVALVDLQLRDDPTHSGGIEVLEYIDKLREGTQAVVVSGTPNVNDAVRSFQAGISAFIQKGSMDSEVVVDAISNAAKQSSIPQYGDYQSLAALLAAPNQTPIWQSEMLATLGCTFDILNKILWQELKPFLPILRNETSEFSLENYTNKQAVAGMFWSKGTGFPIWLSIYSNNGEMVDPPKGIDSKPLREKRYGKTSAAVWRLYGVDRAIFPEFVHDTPWNKTD